VTSWTPWGRECEYGGGDEGTEEEAPAAADVSPTDAATRRQPSAFGRPNFSGLWENVAVEGLERFREVEKGSWHLLWEDEYQHCRIKHQGELMEVLEETLTVTLPGIQLLAGQSVSQLSSSGDTEWHSSRWQGHTWTTHVKRPSLDTDLVQQRYMEGGQMVLSTVVVPRRVLRDAATMDVAVCPPVIRRYALTLVWEYPRGQYLLCLTHLTQAGEVPRRACQQHVRVTQRPCSLDSAANIHTV
jgi:hypothetical protein